MQTGILVCGLNGSGKTTLGKALAQALGYDFIDNEDLFFAKTDPHYLFAAPRSKEEAIDLLIAFVREHPRFVFSAVRGDYGPWVIAQYRLAVYLQTPREMRLQRIRERSFQKFGHRMLPGGDLYQQEESFFSMVAHRQEAYVAQWVDTLSCPVLKADGTRPVAENIAKVVSRLQQSSDH